MRTWIIPLIIAGMFSGCAHVRPPLVEQDSSDVRTTIRAIWQGVKTYYYDRGVWPKSVEELLQARYIVIDSAVLRHWRFLIIDGPPQEICAVSTDPVEVSGEGIPKSVNYQVREGRWKGYGVPHYGDVKLTVAQRAELAIGARQAIEDIARMVQWYYTDKGEWPETVELLERERYMEVDIGVDSTWQFAIIGSPPQAIVAVSKKDMPDGAGRAIEFDIVSGIWRGYGLP